MKLDPLYHWSPVERRDAIMREGLQLHSEPVTHNGELTYPYLCFSPRPERAWSLSGDMEWVSEYEEWDLWLARLPENAEVHVRPNYGAEVEEVKVYTPVPASHLWRVGTRKAEIAKGGLTGDAEIIAFVRWLHSSTPDQTAKQRERMTHVTAPKEIQKLLVDFRIQRS